MKTKIASIFFLFILSTSLVEQKGTELKGEYLGQKPPTKIPEVFAPGIVSTEKGWEAAVTFSPDGKEFFFTRRAKIQGNDNRLMYMQIKNGEWTKPKPAPFAKNFTEYESFISPDGKYLFFHRNNDIYWVDAEIIDDLKPKELTSKEKIPTKESLTNNSLAVFTVIKNLFQQIFAHEFMTQK